MGTKRTLNFSVDLMAGAALMLILQACGGGESDSTPPTDQAGDPGPRTGVFIDAPVEGLHYASTSFNGVTRAGGEFEYMPGEEVSFSLGQVEIGSSAGMDRVSVSSMDSGLKTAILLQSIDADSDEAVIRVSTHELTAATASSVSDYLSDSSVAPALSPALFEQIRADYLASGAEPPVALWPCYAN